MLQSNNLAITLQQLTFILKKNLEPTTNPADN